MSDNWKATRREFVKIAALGTAAFATGGMVSASRAADGPKDFDHSLFINPDELTLRCEPPNMPRKLSFKNFKGPKEQWRTQCREKLAEILGYQQPKDRTPKRIRSIQHGGVTIEAWIMPVNDFVTVPAYLLIPPDGGRKKQAVMAIHGHGRVEPCVGAFDDYHHMFALKAAQAGHLVLAPEMRGFGALGDMTHGDDSHWLDYWRSPREYHFSLVTDSFLFGDTIVGQTVEDLVRWENWLAAAHGVTGVHVAGISYGGDLAITYPAFSKRIKSIYSSGSLGSISVIFRRCYNAIGHCIPHMLKWMDRSDVAGLNVPIPIRAHYGELDKPSKANGSSAYNETVEPALEELREIYKGFGADPSLITLRVTPNTHHEMEIPDWMAFLEKHAK